MSPLLGLFALFSGQLLGASADRPTPEASKVPVEGVHLENRLGRLVPQDLSFTDESGAKVRLSQYLDRRPAVLALVYYECPMLCTLLLNGLVRALRPMNLNPGADFEVLVLSIDPREGPRLAAQKKAAYLGMYDRPGTEAGWHFLTGTEEANRALSESVGFFYAWDEKSQQYAHPAGVTVLTSQGVVSRHFDSVELSSRDLRFGLIEASEQRIGSVIDRILLLCFHYDPTRGKYGVVVMNVLRLAGGVTVLLIAAFIGTMLWHERRVRRLRPPAEHPLEDPPERPLEAKG